MAYQTLGATTDELRTRARELYAQGQTAYDAGRYAEALRLFEQAYRTFTLPDVFVAIASTHAAMENWSQAKHNAQRYLYADPGGRQAARAREIVVLADRHLAPTTAPSVPKEISDSPGPTTTTAPPTVESAYERDSNVGLWLGVGAVGLGVIGLGWWLSRRRR